MDAETTAEFKRVWDENTRQNHRIDVLENEQKNTRDLIISVQRMSISLETMSKEQARQAAAQEEIKNEITEIKQKPADNWNGMTRTIINNITGACALAVGYALIQLMAQYAR